MPILIPGIGAQGGDNPRFVVTNLPVEGFQGEFGQQPTAVVVCDLWLFADGTVARAGIGGDGFGASDRWERSPQALEDSGASTRECAPGICTIEQCLSATGPIPPLSPAIEAAGVAEWLTKERAQISQSQSASSASGKVSSQTA